MVFSVKRNEKCVFANFHRLKTERFEIIAFYSKYNNMIVIRNGNYLRKLELSKVCPSEHIFVFLCVYVTFIKRCINTKTVTVIAKACMNIEYI